MHYSYNNKTSGRRLDSRTSSRLFDFVREVDLQMEITDKLTKKIQETRYLAVDNTERYRVIMRICFLNYEKLKYWLYKEDIYEVVKMNEHFETYTLEQCQQDLHSLVEWGNLVTIQDTSHIHSLEEFKNKKYRYQMSKYAVEIERLVIRLENLEIEGASLEPTLLERIRNHIGRLVEVTDYNVEQVYTWWNDLNNDFIRLNQNYLAYMSDLNSIKAEEMMKTNAFLIFKDWLIEYLRTFVKSLQKNVGIIEKGLLAITNEQFETIISKVTQYEHAIPRIAGEVDITSLEEKNRGCLESIYEWFVGSRGRENEANKLFDATNEIIRKITRYAIQISEVGSGGANRKEEYAQVASIFLKCKDINEAHCLSAMVFGMGESVHLKGNVERKTDSHNSGVYEEEPLQVIIKPRVRTYREKANRSAMKDYSREKEALMLKTLQKIEENKRKIQQLIVDGKIEFRNLPVIEPEVREILLGWLSNAFENSNKRGRTDDGQYYYVDIERNKQKCTVRCSDGIFIMPCMTIVFDE